MRACDDAVQCDHCGQPPPARSARPCLPCRCSASSTRTSTPWPPVAPPRLPATSQPAAAASMIGKALG
eukprot:4367791-Prymnesium_polylepis.1